MSRRNKKKTIDEPFVAIIKHMIKSPAFKKLTNASRVAFLLLRAQVKSANQVEVIFPYGDAAEYMDRHTFSRAIRQLVEFGFIEKTDFGGMYRRTNVYRFVKGWREIK